MKELTIEQKAELYDQAIAHARLLLKIIGNATLGNLVLKNEFENMFPELKKNEDERVRNKLIEFFKGYSPDEEWWGNITQEDILAWLEKQKDKDKLIQELGKYKVKYTQEVLSHQLEKQGEQKSTDEVKPKFKVGAWITIDKPCQIISINNNRNYIVQYCDDEKTHELSKNFCESHFHIWSIKDAKDGDVLAAEDKVFIYNGKLDLRGRVCAYCGIYKTYDGLRFTECAIGNYFTYKEPYPATKEQRVQLEKAMTDAGYTFDFEKKELKRIVTPIFHIGDRVRYKEHACDGIITEITDTDYICGDAKLPISTQDKLELVEQKSAWSEEDEKNYDISLKIMCASNKSEKLINNLYDWFKSLKDRVHPQSTWKPSEEMLEALYKAIPENVMAMSEDEMLLDKLYQGLKYGRVLSKN